MKTNLNGQNIGVIYISENAEATKFLEDSLAELDVEVIVKDPATRGDKPKLCITGSNKHGRQEIVIRPYRCRMDKFNMENVIGQINSYGKEGVITIHHPNGKHYCFLNTPIYYSDWV